ncbi:MAG: hypothetical protein R2880_10695 [Deinococcales bacterium]
MKPYSSYRINPTNQKSFEDKNHPPPLAYPSREQPPPAFGVPLHGRGISYAVLDSIPLFGGVAGEA